VVESVPVRIAVVAPPWAPFRPPCTAGSSRQSTPKQGYRNACRAAVEGYFSVDRVIGEHLELFDDVVAGRTVRGSGQASGNGGSALPEADGDAVTSGVESAPPSGSGGSTRQS
jgi:hypothetical protein